MYPFPEEGENLASLMGYSYKCFLQLPKEYSQIRMAEEDKEKTGFHTEERAYCFTHIPKELKNSAATLQRMMEKVLTDQRGRNVEIYLEEIVVKRKSELDLVQDVQKSLRKLKRVNIKIDPAMSSFGVKEGRFLGYMVEGNHTPTTEYERRHKKEIMDAMVPFHRTRPSVEEISSSKKGKAKNNAPGTKSNCNREASGSN
ncbi:hypothetical protein Tco_0195110 [Tanacetum coccineum]